MGKVCLFSFYGYVSDLQKMACHWHFLHCVCVTTMIMFICMKETIEPWNIINVLLSYGKCSEMY